ncbi:hypothetical protein PAHAL_9G555000 [Panicum hallii]|uniref:Uncharacterized protein n=1 Tax=Panicum hallii TaxID=206008 RepID=A0A2T8I5V3_9POAL|nr:hypothetical protein PAHAL_9G555000 [Panicum hallii]
MRRSKGAPNVRGAVAALLLLTSHAGLALPSNGEPLRREGWRRLQLGGGEGSTLARTHTRLTCAAFLLPAPPRDAPVGDVVSPQAAHEAGGELWAAAHEVGGQLRAGNGRSRGGKVPWCCSRFFKILQWLIQNVEVEIHVATCCHGLILGLFSSPRVNAKKP